VVGHDTVEKSSTVYRALRQNPKPVVPRENHVRHNTREIENRPWDDLKQDTVMPASPARAGYKK
jgi:hypothetical protein